MFKNIVYICKFYMCKVFILFMVIFEFNYYFNFSRNMCFFFCNDLKFFCMFFMCIIINEIIDICFLNVR